MIKKILTFAALFAVAINGINAQTAASEVDSKKQTLFSSANHVSTPYRIPAVATLNNGTVLAIADQRPCGNDVGHGEVDIYAKVGTIAADGSYNWNPATNDPSVNGGIKIADGNSDNGYGDAAVVVDRESGKVLVICVAGKQVFSSGSSSSHNKMARIVGSADGLTWESPQDVTTAFFDNLLPKAYTMFMASGRMIQSKQVKVGSHYRIYGALLVKDGKNKNYKNYVVYSDNLGESWSILGTSYAISNADEAKVEELPNGDIVLSSRTSGGRIFNVYSMSNDSWGSSPSTYTFANGAEACNGEILLYEGLVDANGTKYNVMLQSLPTASSRGNVAVYYKAFATDKSSWSVSDFTSGWTKGIEVDNGKSAYSTMTILPDGQVGFLYEDDYDTSKANGGYSNIVYVPLTVEEITGGAFSAPVPQQPEEPETPETPVDPNPNPDSSAKEYIVEPTEGNIGNAPYYIATFSANETTKAPTGVRVYYAKSASDEEVTITQLLSGIVPANTGVILIASGDAPFKMASTTENVAALNSNLLVGTLDTVNYTFVGNSSYALAVKGSGELAGQFAFCKVAVGKTLQGYNNRAYLDLSGYGAANSANVRLTFDGTTDIEGVDADEYAPIEYYNLQGVKVENPQKGIYIKRQGTTVTKVMM